MKEQVNDEPKFVVVVGTSDGGICALEKLVMQLNPQLDAAYFLVLYRIKNNCTVYYRETSNVKRE